MFPVKPLAPPPSPPTTAAVINWKSLGGDERHSVTVHTLWYVSHDSATSLMWPWSLSRDQVDGIVLSAQVGVGRRASEGGDCGISWRCSDEMVWGGNQGWGREALRRVELRPVTWNVSGQVNVWLVGWFVKQKVRKSVGQTRSVSHAGFAYQKLKDWFWSFNSLLLPCCVMFPWAEDVCFPSLLHLLSVDFALSVLFFLRCCLTRS